MTWLLRSLSHFNTGLIISNVRPYFYTFEKLPVFTNKNSNIYLLAFLKFNNILQHDFLIALSYSGCTYRVRRKHPRELFVRGRKEPGQVWRVELNSWSSFFNLKSNCTTMKHLNYIYVICRPGGPYREKLCPRS